MADVVLAKGAHGERNGVADGGVELGGESLQFVVRRSVDSNTGAVHADQHTSKRVRRSSDVASHFREPETSIIRIGSGDTCSRARYGQDDDVFVRYESALPSPSGRHPGVFALANDLAHSGILSEEEWRWWRQSNDWFNAAYINPADVDPTIFDRSLHSHK